MKNSTKIVALGACAACCFLPVAGPLLAGTVAGSAFAGLGLGTVAWLAGLGVAGLAAFALLRFGHRARTPNCAASENACGCSAPAGIAGLVQSTTPAPIACTLTPGDFRERTIWIRDLARQSLIHVRREPLALHLSYAADAGGRVREMVRKEESCCAFLRFDLREDANGIHLIITAPEDAREAANELFAHFAPELARSMSLSLSMQKELVRT